MIERLGAKDNACYRRALRLASVRLANFQFLQGRQIPCHTWARKLADVYLATAETSGRIVFDWIFGPDVGAGVRGKATSTGVCSVVGLVRSWRK